MPLATNLMGVGMSPELAKRLGAGVATVVAAGTTQGAATALSTLNRVVNLTTASSEDSVVLPSGAELLDMFVVHNPSSTTANIFPPSSGTIDSGSANAAVTLAQYKTRIFIRVTSTNWVSILTA
jgi:hypothetical protein